MNEADAVLWRAWLAANAMRSVCPDAGEQASDARRELGAMPRAIGLLRSSGSGSTETEPAAPAPGPG